MFDNMPTACIVSLGGHRRGRSCWPRSPATPSRGLRFPGSNIVFFVILATFMIPFQAIITPLYIVLKKLELHNSLLGLTVVYITFHLPFGLFMMRNAFTRCRWRWRRRRRSTGAASSGRCGTSCCRSP